MSVPRCRFRGLAAVRTSAFVGVLAMCCGLCPGADGAPSTEDVDVARDFSAIPAGYERLSSATGYLDGGVMVAMESFERPRV
ncbi:MAG: hypothetical protein AAF297_02595 [Planctomycetota bacterium]